MYEDKPNEYRPLLEADPPTFVDRVDTPWSQVPDLPEYNSAAYRRILRDLQRLQRDATEDDSTSRGILILGEAGTGKTHLLMRVAKNLSATNHILFVRKPNNEEAVAQHVWSNIVHSLSRKIPGGGSDRSQIDDLLAHVFSSVLIPEFEQDIREGTDVNQRHRWVQLLRANPFNLFSMLGEGERRTQNMRAIRRRTLRYLQVHHPSVDQHIAHVLITYCFVSREERKRMLLTWLSGQDIDEVEAEALGLPASWVIADAAATDVSFQQQREEQALRAIRTIGTLSTHYQPLILAFDQLEGLRDEERLTRRWGDVVREVFTMTPNMLVVTCIFPSLWESWFTHALDQSVAQRIAQSQVTLEQFETKHGLRMLETHLRESFTKHRLPNNIYPFSPLDVQSLCLHASSARTFIQNARDAFEGWLDQKDGVAEVISAASVEIVVTQDDIDRCLEKHLTKFEEEQRRSYLTDIPIEEDFIGRMRSTFKTLLDHSPVSVSYERAQLETRVMAPNLVIQHSESGGSVCLAIMYRTGYSFAARLKNLRQLHGREFDHLVILRDQRCAPLGPKCRQYIDDLQLDDIPFIHADVGEISLLNGLYDVLVAIEEHDVAVGASSIDKGQFSQYLRAHQVLRRSQLFREASRGSAFLQHVMTTEVETDTKPQDDARTGDSNSLVAMASFTAHPLDLGDTGRPYSSDSGPSSDNVTDAGANAYVLRSPTPTSRNTTSHKSVKSPSENIKCEDGRLDVDILIGDKSKDSPHVGVLGTLSDDSRKLAISLVKPQCLAVLGYMGSGKSYALGVLIENALLRVPNLINHSRPLSVVAFNFRRNPEARFEYGGFACRNSDAVQRERLNTQYIAGPAAIQQVNVFAFAPEIERRQHEYTGLRQYPIQFLSEELGAEHWEILMKPPTAQAEYMDIIRDIIQKLYYADRLTYRNLERQIENDERLSDSQRRRAMNRLSFAERWICDDRKYEWSDVLAEGVLNIVDLRMQTLEPSEALKLCLIVTDLVRRTRNGVNKVIVFDEAHEYVDSKQLVSELENAITQIRHDGLSFVLASQFPDRIPERIFKYLLTRLIFKLPHSKGVNYLRKMAANLASLSSYQVGNLDLEQGVCLIQTDDDCTDVLLRRPQLLQVRPRCTQHGGATVRQTDANFTAEAAPVAEPEPSIGDDPSEDNGKTLAELNDEFGISWNRFLALLTLPTNAGLTPDMTLAEARRVAANGRH